MSSVFFHTTDLKSFVFDRSLHLSNSIDESLPYKGYVYLLVSLIPGGVAIKIGETSNLSKRMRTYASNKSIYRFSRCIEVGGKSPSDAKKKILAMETDLIEKLCNLEGFTLFEGTEEHFLVQAEALPTLEEIFKNQRPQTIVKYQDPEIPFIYFRDKPSDLQKNSGRQISSAMVEGFHLINLHARTQGGKTGAVMFSVVVLIQEMMKSGKKLGRDYKVSITTPLNHLEWKEQTVGRLPMIESPIQEDTPLLKNEDVMILADFLKKIHGFTNDLKIPQFFFIDEYQRATKRNQTVDKFLKQVLKLNTELFGQSPKDFVNMLKKRQIYFVFVSATDFYMNWLSKEDDYAPFFKNIELPVGPGYIKWEDYYNAGLIKDAIKPFDDKFKTLTTNFKNALKTFLQSEDNKKYIVIRKESRLNIELLKNALREEFGDQIQILEHHGENKLNANLLAMKPPMPTVIILKDYWRAAQTLNAEHIGVVFDRFVKNTGLQTVDTILQGLLGRLTGYRGRLLDITIYTNKEQLDAYLDQSKAVPLDLKTKQEAEGRTYFVESSRENIVVDIPLVLQKNFSVKALKSWIEKLPEVSSYEKTVIRLIPEQKSRISAAKLKSYKDVDKAFFKNGDVNSQPLTSVVSGGLEEGKTSIWANYDTKNPKKVKLTIVCPKKEEVSGSVAIKQGVLGYK